MCFMIGFSYFINIYYKPIIKDLKMIDEIISKVWVNSLNNSWNENALQSIYKCNDYLR